VGVIQIVGGEAQTRAALRQLIAGALARIRLPFELVSADAISREASGGPVVTIHADYTVDTRAGNGENTIESSHLLLGILPASITGDLPLNPVHEGGIEWPTCHDEHNEWPICHDKYPIVESVHIWPGLNPASFEQWLRLGLATAQARHGAQTAQQTLVSALIDARQQWAAKIHSGPVQELVAGTFLLELLPDNAGEAALAQVQNALAQLRNLCQSLNPPTLHDFGLAAALRSTVRERQRQDSTLDPTWDLDPDAPELDAHGRAVLFLIFETALAALLAQAGACRITQITLVEEAAARGAVRVRLAIAWKVSDTTAPGVEAEGADDSGNDGSPAELLQPILPLLGQLAHALAGETQLTQTRSAGEFSVCVPVPLGQA
jgi:signal transduction histidine kinase